LPSSTVARVWLPVPHIDPDQEVKILAVDFPGQHQITREPEFGNQIFYFESQPSRKGTLSFSIRYQIIRRELMIETIRPIAAEDTSRFMQPDSRVPIAGKPLRLIKGKRLPMDQLDTARVIYDIVRQHMRYSKEGTGWGRGDSEWACDSGFGNCSDFHSLFISLARSQKLPAKFEIGFLLPETHGSGEIAGYHCWAKFKPAGRGWVPVDISEASRHPELGAYYFGNLSENRVTFSTGRDIELVPKQQGPRLNFFIYPYVEVDGRPYPPEQISSQFTYRDTSASDRK
jgi:hypothetical protein